MLVLTRDRNQPDELLQVTGRDVSEDAYALTFTAGVWTLDGGSLETAARSLVILSVGTVAGSSDLNLWAVGQFDHK